MTAEVGAKVEAAGGEGATPDPPAAKTMAITVPGGRVVSLEHDLEFGVVADIAQRHAVSWGLLLAAPMHREVPPQALGDLYLACCDEAGVVQPAKITPRMVFEALTAIPDDLPAWYEGGDPKAGCLASRETAPQATT